jgi:hypothetical protein
MAQWFRILVHDGDPNWIEKTKEQSHMPPGVSARSYGPKGKPGTPTLWQIEGSSLEVLGQAFMQVAKLKDQSSPDDCQCGAYVNQDNMECICFHRNISTKPDKPEGPAPIPPGGVEGHHE